MDALGATAADRPTVEAINAAVSFMVIGADRRRNMQWKKVADLWRGDNKMQEIGSALLDGFPHRPHPITPGIDTLALDYHQKKTELTFSEDDVSSLGFRKGGKAELNRYKKGGDETKAPNLGSSGFPRE